MNRWTVLIAAALTCFLVALGCSRGGGNPMAPASEPGIANGQSPGNPTQTHLWGYYDVYIDIPTQSATAVVNRDVMFAANVVQFVNGSAANLSFNIIGTPYTTSYVDVDIDVTLRHPLPGLAVYNGYDVRGVFIANGSSKLEYNSPNLTYADYGSSDQVMYDYAQTAKEIHPGKPGMPDGYTRWWNPTEFTVPGVLGYTPGMFATPGYNGTATLNPYKYYADQLGVTGDLWTFLTATVGHGVFSAGSSNVRNYYLRFPMPTAGVKYGYAVIANWKGEKPADHPANAPEAVGLSVAVTPDIYYVSDTDKGGTLKLDMNFLKAWGETPSTIYVESTALNTNPYQLSTPEMIPVGGGTNYSTYHVEIPANNVTSTEGNEFWVIAQYDTLNYNNEYAVPNQADGDKLAAFFRYDLFVASKPYNRPPVCDVDVLGPLTGWNQVKCVFNATESVDPDPGDTITYAWDFDGNGVYGESPGDDFTGAASNPTHTYTADYTGNVNLKVSDQKGAFSTCNVGVTIAVKPTVLFFWDGTKGIGGDISPICGSGWAYLESPYFCWDENGNEDYYNNLSCGAIKTPPLNIPTGVSSVHVAIKHWGAAEDYWDGALLGYSTNGTTVTWNAPSKTVFTYSSGTNFNNSSNYIYGVTQNGCCGFSALSTYGWLGRSFQGASGWGSPSAPVSSDFTCNGLKGQNGTSICFGFLSDSSVVYRYGFSIREIKVYVVP